MSLTLKVINHQLDGKAAMFASLDVVLPLQDGGKSVSSWLNPKQMVLCHAAINSTVMMWSAAAPPASVSKSIGCQDHNVQVGKADDEAEKSYVCVVPAEHFTKAVLTHQWITARAWMQGSDPRVTIHEPRLGARRMSVMRDVLSHEGRSERTHGRYLLRFTNAGPTQLVRYMEQLPFFLRPLWHTFHATLEFPEKSTEKLSGLTAMRRLDLQLVPSNGQHMPTEIFMTVTVPHRGVVSVFLDVRKEFIQVREFSYACEKGFDVSSAAWMELELPDTGKIPNFTTPCSSDCFVQLLSPRKAPGASGTWRLQFTHGLIVLLPMPDFSMPFNVIALSSTALTFFFGSVFRLTAAGRMPHWLLKKDNPTKSFLARSLRPALGLVVVGSIYGLSILEPSHLLSLRTALPKAASPAVDMLESLRDTVHSLIGS